MNATHTINYAHTGIEAIAARVKELNTTTKTLGMLVAAPFLGLAFVLILPILGLGMLLVLATKALVRNPQVVKRLALFAAAPFVSLVYLIAFPFVGIGALVYYGVRAARE